MKPAVLIVTCLAIFLGIGLLADLGFAACPRDQKPIPVSNPSTPLQVQPEDNPLISVSAFSVLVF